MFKKIYYLAAVLTASLFFAAPSFGATMPTQDSDAPYAKQGAGDCLECHDEGLAAKILHTPHAQQSDGRSPFASHACESCHGASPEHMRKVEGEKVPPLPAITFGINSKTPVAEQNAVCVECHEAGMRKSWTGSRHETSGTACASCHDVHAIKDPALVKAEQAEVCFSCHTEQRALAHSRSRHPIKEGKVACSDCHNPHGSVGPKLLVEATVNETCYNCHAEKRGPFLWEHAPARRDCTTCHAPHGSNNPGMLNTKGSFLCVSCHQYGGHVDLPRYNRQSATIGQGCINCHTAIHGSNHPSGVKLTR